MGDLHPGLQFPVLGGPAHASAGHLDLPSTVFPTVAAEIEGHFDLATGAEVKGVFVLVDVGLPMTLGCYYLAETGFPANDLFLMLRNQTTWSWKRTVRAGDDARLDALHADELLGAGEP